MTDRTPRVSIGLAVFNGEKYLSEAIESILAQSFTDFELIISDNASTDQTAQICKKYATQDDRIQYHRNPTNIGGANNENLTFKMSKGEYFRWAAHDDVCAPTLIEKCVRLLDENPDVVLCHTNVVEIDENGNHCGMSSRNNGRYENPYERFRSIAGSKDFLEETYGVIRSCVMQRTRLQLNYTASDRTLMCELALYGRFHQIEEPLFYKRFHPGNVYIDWRTRMAWFDKSYEGKIAFPFWIQFLDYLVTIRRATPGFFASLQCYLYILGPWFITHLKNLVKDLIVAGLMLIHSFEWRRKRYADTNNWS